MPSTGSAARSKREAEPEAPVSDEVVSAFRRGPLVLACLARTGEQRVVVDGTPVRNRAGARVFAGQLTAVFYGIGIAGLRRVADIPGGGPSNQGRPEKAARDDVGSRDSRGIVMNGEPLMSREGMDSQWNREDLDEYDRYGAMGGVR